LAASNTETISGERDIAAVCSKVALFASRVMLTETEGRDRRRRSSVVSRLMIALTRASLFIADVVWETESGVIVCTERAGAEKTPTAAPLLFVLL